MRQAKLPTKKSKTSSVYVREYLRSSMTKSSSMTKTIIIGKLHLQSEKRNRQTLLTNCTKVNYSQHVSSLALFIVEYVPSVCFSLCPLMWVPKLLDDICILHRCFHIVMTLGPILQRWQIKRAPTLDINLSGYILFHHTRLGCKS
jgi:hypothetical protein